MINDNKVNRDINKIRNNDHIDKDNQEIINR